MPIRKYSFDECFQTFPDIEIPDNFKNFWMDALDELKKIPVNPKHKLLLKKSMGRESRFEIHFQSYGRYSVKAFLSIPRKRSKVPAVISFHDYGEYNTLSKYYTDAGIAHLAVVLRDHAKISVQTESDEEKEFGYFHQYGMESLENSYPYSCILDAVRAVDFLRLEKDIDKSRIGICGKGFGAFLAVFASVLRPENIKSMVLERMGFVVLGRWMQESESPAAVEFRDMVQRSRNKNKIRKNLPLIDPLNLADLIKIPVLFSIHLDDPQHSPACSFGFFNRLRTDKVMELYPEHSSDPRGDKQHQKTVHFFQESLNR